MPTQSARQTLVTVDGIQGYWAQRTGAEGQSDVTRVYNGGDDTPELLTGPATYTDLVVTRPYDSVRDGATIPFLLAGVGKWRTTLHTTDTDENYIPGGPSRTFIGKLTHVKLPETDAGSAAGQTIALTFAIASVG